MQIWNCFRELFFKYLVLFLEVIERFISRFLWIVRVLFFLLLDVTLFSIFGKLVNVCQGCSSSSLFLFKIIVFFPSN
jgi:hypothetical protein